MYGQFILLFLIFICLRQVDVWTIHIIILDFALLFSLVALGHTLNVII
jgi:hypothetical protein